MICGIDLGTTYSAISWYDAENNRLTTVELVNAADGQTSIRSVVYYPAGEPPVVGDTAWNAARQHPDRVVVGIKRSMGSPSYTFPVDGASYTPQQVSAEILKVLVQDAEAFGGESVTGAVITVPAYFGDNECAATREAGELAGLKVLGLMAEPHAAALAYVVEKASAFEEKDLLVYDLGGGTFDITLIHAEPITQEVTDGGEKKQLPSLRMKTITKEGNAALGGLDWDRALAKLVNEKALEQHGVDVLADPKNEAFVLDSVEKAKRILSRLASVAIPVDVTGKSVEVSRVEFEERTEGLLFQTECLVEQVLKDAVTSFQERARQEGKGGDEVNAINLDYVKKQIGIMLTGGSSKMPMVRTMLERVTGKAPIQYGNPELLVTRGAAYYAYIQGLAASQPPSPQPGGSGSPTKQGGTQIEIIDTTPVSIGVAALRSDGSGGYREVYAEVLPKNTEQDKKVRKDFQKIGDGVTEIPIDLYKCLDHDPKNTDFSDPNLCKLLKTFIIKGLPSGGRKGEIVSVDLFCDKDGIIRGTARDQTSGQSVDIEYKVS